MCLTRNDHLANCVADCKTASLGTIFDTAGTTICSACDSGRKCITGGNFVGLCAQGKCFDTNRNVFSAHRAFLQ